MINILGTRHFIPLERLMCLSQKGKNQSQDSSRGEGSKRGRGKKNFKGRGGSDNQGKRYNIYYVCCVKNGHDAKACRTP